MPSRANLVLGIDIGGSGIKGAPVNIKKGVLISERYRIPTPQPATPRAVAKTVHEIMKATSWDGPIGCTVPARVQNGIVTSAANIDDAWIGTKAAKLFKNECGVPVAVMNDADAAGLAEMAFGAGRKAKGTTLMLTFGTGIGSALFIGDTLVPNMEFGHMRYDHRIAEHFAADSVRSKEKMTWERWARRRVQPLLEYYEFLFSPDLIIVGGGVSRPDRWARYVDQLKTKAKIMPAALGNEAGIVGAALAAKRIATKDAKRRAKASNTSS